MRETTTFIYVGDPQCSRIMGKYPDYSVWEGLLTKAVETEGNNGLLVLGGDVVNRGNKDKEWKAFFESLDRTMVDCKALVTPVNGARESTGVYAGRFLNSGNGPTGYETNFFSFTFGCCHFIVLDSDYMGNTTEEARSYIGGWIEKDLSANNSPVVLAVMHHPMYSLGTSLEDDMRAKAMREHYMLLLYEWGVDFVLCGHQHAYCRTKEMDAPYVIQIMGVSGTKYFDATNKGDMDVCLENVSVATIFETDGESISLKTIDKNGRIIDRYTKKVRSPEKKSCEAIDNGDERSADPLRPANDDGIVVVWNDGRCKEFVTDKQIEELEKVEADYSMMMRGKLIYETRTGIRLEELLEKAGWIIAREESGNEIDVNDDFAIVLTSGNGRQTILNIRDVLEGGCFREGNNGRVIRERAVPAILFEEDGKYVFACGQESPEHYNGRCWARDIREVEIRKIGIER